MPLSGPNAATVTTLLQFAGEPTGPESLPAAATKMAPCSSTKSTTCCSNDEHALAPPSDKFMTLTLLAPMAGTPLICAPASHAAPSMMSDDALGRCGGAMTRPAFQFKPATPMLLFAAAPMVPATWV